MAIWINEKLTSYSYKKTLLSKVIAGSEKLLIWLEGVEKDFSFKINSNIFGIAGSSIGTNAGIYFTKNQLKEIYESMPEGAVLKIAACNCIGDVEKDFKKDNDMIQVGYNSFAPSTHPDIINLQKKWQKYLN